MKKTMIYAENIDEKALEQFESAMKMPYAVQGALMPDVHLGYSLPIGGVVATDNVIVPAWVGYDIGCGMCALKTDLVLEDIMERREDILKSIYRAIPIGLGGTHNTKQPWLESDELFRTAIVDNLLAKKGRQLGTLGSGNHFIEIGVDKEDHVWIIIHSGSRGLGHGVATHYMKVASKSDKAREGHFGLSVTSLEGQHYLTDLNFCLEFALESRKRMLAETYFDICRTIGNATPSMIGSEHMINRNHNHAEKNSDGLYIHRKGATHAEKGMLGVIPGNMRDGSFIVKGKGNYDSLCSSSHGAGRVLGRAQARRELSLEEFKETMSNADVVGKVEDSTIDESPMAYKNIFDVMELQKDLVEVVDYVRPILNIKA